MNSHMLNNLDNITRRHPHAGIILMGDFNTLPDSALLIYPLKQVVKTPTRQQSLLDKIYTNISDWYKVPFTAPALGKSDHLAVVMQAASSGHYTGGQTVAVSVRSNCPAGRATFCDELRNIRWSVLYDMTTCEEMVSMFYNVVITTLDKHLPYRTAKRHSTDRPWITDSFRRLIRCRQNALSRRDMTKYRSLRNKVNRMSRKLRKRFMPVV